MKSYVGYAKGPMMRNRNTPEKANDFATLLRGLSVTRLRGYACSANHGSEGVNERTAFLRNRVTNSIQVSVSQGLARLRMIAILA